MKPIRCLSRVFENQVRSIVNQVRPDRQTLLFSATFKGKVEGLARSILSNPVRVTIGKVGSANQDIKQYVHVLVDNNAKWPWLASRLNGFLQFGKVLIFTRSIASVEELSRNLTSRGGMPNVVSLSGDLDPASRHNSLKKFKDGHSAVMVATDLASRGLDIKDVHTVINFDISKSMDQHIHRIGRTCRLGVDGVSEGSAHTLITRGEKDFAVQLVAHLHASKQPVSNALQDLASTSKKRKKDPSDVGKRAGLGYKAASSSFARSQPPAMTTQKQREEHDIPEVQIRPAKVDWVHRITTTIAPKHVQDDSTRAAVQAALAVAEAAMKTGSTGSSAGPPTVAPTQ
eukprot:gnl/TRDRNA2_/TRDRNA2_96694_c0_seq1.p1 gnl/TRDRNA2_/TRDRNA2_96694_c0~~gnl/TRDRNA2_/TRDRNA2_96694_c0_seq1.p1  ORF type:complete len:343 (-),score=41.48 gnl/TRDRNA2_/TRDRNA2_96694_c0_seq1:616-1644(-)